VKVFRMGRYTRFLIVGASNALVDLLVLNILLFIWPTKSPLTLVTYNSIAVVLSISNSYVWNRLWTFSDVSSGDFREKCIFMLQALVNITVNDTILVWLSMFLRSYGLLSTFVQSNAAKGIAMFVSSSISYLLMRFLIFRVAASSGTSSTPSAENQS